MRKGIMLFFVLLFGFSLISCTSDDDDSGGPDPIIGDWEEDDPYWGSDWSDNFSVEENLEGDGQFWVFFDEPSSTIVYCEYDLAVEVVGEEYKFDLECGDSADYDFEMVCGMNEAGDELDCEVTDGWGDGWESKFKRD